MKTVICTRCESSLVDSEVGQAGCSVCRDVDCIGCYDGVGACINCRKEYLVSHEDRLGGSCGQESPLCTTCLASLTDVLNQNSIEGYDRRQVMRNLQDDLDEIVRRNAWRIRHRQGDGNSAMNEFDMISALIMTAMHEYEIRDAQDCLENYWVVGGRVIIDDRNGRWKDLQSGEENVGILSFIVHLGYANDEDEAWDYGLFIDTLCDCVDAHKKNCKYPRRVSYPPLEALA